jgi:hypothetical protein
MSQSVQQPQCATSRGADRSTAKTSDREIELRWAACCPTDTLLKRMLRLIFPDQRKHERHLVPPLVGYLGAVRAASRPYALADISLSGFCMLTDERWTPGTEMPVTLQQVKLPGNNPECFTVQATVARCGSDGVGFSMVLCEEDSGAAHGNPLQARWISRPEIQQLLNRLKEPPQLKAAEAEQPVGLQETGDAAQPGPALRPASQGNR